MEHRRQYTDYREISANIPSLLLYLVISLVCAYPSAIKYAMTGATDLPNATKTVLSAAGIKSLNTSAI